jgi:hypothetical protein
MKKREEFLIKCGIKQEEEHHIKQAREEYKCKCCGYNILRLNFYYAVLSTLPIGYHRIANITIERLCIECAKKDNEYATKGDFK